MNFFFLGLLSAVIGSALDPQTIKAEVKKAAEELNVRCDTPECIDKLADNIAANLAARTTTTTTTTRKKGGRPPTSDIFKGAYELDDATFAKFIKDSQVPVMILLYAPWCGHCKAMASDYSKLAKKYNGAGTANIIAINADGNRTAGSKFKVKGFPTLVYTPQAGEKPRSYNGGRDFDSLDAFVAQHAKPVPVPIYPILGQTTLDQHCKDTCMIAVLEDVNDKKILRDLELAGKPEVPMLIAKSGQNFEFEEKAGVSGVYPSLVTLAGNKYGTYTGKFEREKLSKYVETVASGKRGLLPAINFPKWATVHDEL